MPVAETQTLLDLPEDTLLRIFSKLSSDDLPSLSLACAHFAHLCRTELLWQSWSESRWPHLAGKSPRSCRSLSWRELHRQRACIPGWRFHWALMDQVDLSLKAILAEQDWHATHEPSECGCVHDSTELFLSLIVKLCAVINGPRLQLTEDWRNFVVSSVLKPRANGTILAYVDYIMSELDIFYDAFETGETHGVLEILLKSLRSASALALLLDEIDHQLGDGILDVAANKPEITHLRKHLADLVESLHSLEMEGFAIAVPIHLRPAGLPRSHVWWHEKAHVLVAGRIHPC